MEVVYGGVCGFVGGGGVVGRFVDAEDDVDVFSRLDTMPPASNFILVDNNVCYIIRVIHLNYMGSIFCHVFYIHVHTRYKHY